MKRVTVLGIFSFALILTHPGSVRGQNMQAPQTVAEAAFRSRWVGPQADRMIMDDALMVSTEDREIDPITDWATKLREGLFYGSLRIMPGLGAGVEYSNRTTSGQNLDSQDDSSFYLAPSLGLNYTRDFGPVSLSLAYGGGLVYYLNENYQPTRGGKRNPINQTMQFKLGQVGRRYEANLNMGGTYGTGQDIQVGGQTTTTTGYVSGDYTHLISEYMKAIGYAGVSTEITRYGDSDERGSNFYMGAVGASLNWMVTGKTTLGWNVEGGISQQEIMYPALQAGPTQVVMVEEKQNDGTVLLVPTLVSTAAVQTQHEESISRQYVQTMLNAEHSLTSKVVLTGGLGVGYVTDDQVQNANSEYVGVRPVYQLGVNYDPSPKTRLSASLRFGQTDIVPAIRLTAQWRPREMTGFSLAIYQNQNFSSFTVSQYQVNRGIIGTVDQRFFSKLKVSLSCGWQQTENKSLSTTAVSSSNDYDYAFASGNLRWDINQWLYWQTTLWTSNDERYGQSDNGLPEMTVTTGLNLLF